MKTILVPLTGYQNDASALAAAYLVARRFKGRIEALAVRPDAMQIVTTAAVQQFGGTKVHSAEAIHTLEKAAGNASTAAFVAFDEFLKRQAPADMVEATLQQTQGEPVRDTAAAARFADLAVLGRAAEGAEFSLDAIGNILVACGRPVLVVPDAPSAAIGATIAVAWKETAEAARAVTAAMPFLERAEKIVVISASDSDFDAEASAESAEKLASRLRRYGMRVESRGLASGISAADSLLKAAHDAHADMLVMGAYGHGRLRELVFGGFTRAVLQNTNLPVLMLH
jgi:nucleotide-binding universal stress UspA family protein